MKRVAREAGFAFLAWLVPFAVSVGIFPLKSSNPPLFETLMGVVLTMSTVLLACVYLRRHGADYLWHGARIGALWAMANWVLDALMFSGGPMKMTAEQYIADIGLAYLAIPAITIGLGYTADGARGARPEVRSHAVV